VSLCAVILAVSKMSLLDDKTPLLYSIVLEANGKLLITFNGEARLT